MKRLALMLALIIAVVACDKEEKQEIVTLFDWDSIIEEIGTTNLSAMEVLKSLGENEYWAKSIEYDYYEKDGKTIESLQLGNGKPASSSKIIYRYVDDLLFTYEKKSGDEVVEQQYSIKASNGMFYFYDNGKLRFKYKIIAYDNRQVLIEQYYPEEGRYSTDEGKILYKKTLYKRKSSKTIWWIKPKNEIKVISFNVYVSNSDEANNWGQRKQAAINMINEEQPTIFGLQEATLHQMQYLTSNLEKYGWVGVGREDGISAGEHMAIFYLKSEIELLDSGTFWLSETPDEPSIGWDAAYKRTCTWTKLKMKKTGVEFAYLNSHLDHVGKEAQRNGLALIVERCAEIAPKGTTVFFTADFNASTDDAIFEPLKADMLDARETAPETDRRATYNGLNAENINNPALVIDHIFYRGAEAHTFKVLDKYYGAPFISDHYPVVMTATF